MLGTPGKLSGTEASNGMYKGVNSLYLYIVAIDGDTTLAERKESASVA